MQKMLLKYKYIILGGLVLIIIFHFSFSREGMSTGDCDYKYLDAASKSGDGYMSWPLETKKNFWRKQRRTLGGSPFDDSSLENQNKMINFQLPGPDYENLRNIMVDTHLEEIEYFLKNGQYPRSNFIKKKLETMQPRDIQNFSQAPDRYVITVTLLNALKNSNDSFDKKAYSIYMGTTPQPCSSSPSSYSSPSSSAPLLNAQQAKEQLTSVCKFFLNNSQ